MPYVVLALGFVALAVYLSERKTTAAIPSDSSPSSPSVIVITRTETVTAPSSPAPAPVATQRAPTSIPTTPVHKAGLVANPFAQAGLQVAAPFTPQIVGGTLETAGAGVARASSPFGGAAAGTGANTQAGLPRLGQGVAEELGQAGADVSGATGLGLVGVFASSSSKIAGKSEKEQRAIFGKAALATVQTGISAAVPFVGGVVSTIVGLGAQTHEGQRAVKATGVAISQGYEAQKNFFTSGRLSLGSTQRERKSSFFSSVDSRVAELQQGGKLDEKDVSGLRQALAYGYTFSGGVDLSKIELKAGTNPFRESYKLPVKEN